MTGDGGLEDDGADVAVSPNEAADPRRLIDATFPEDICARFEIHSYKSAAVVLAEAHTAEFADLLGALRSFSLTTDMIRRAGGNESEVPKLISQVLRPLKWHETVVQGDLLVRRRWKEQVGLSPSGKPKFQKYESETLRERYLDGHKVDYVKGRVAFDLEWNSKDQTFDRDLYAFAAFAQTGLIDVGVILTRGASLNPVIRKMGSALNKDGTHERKPSGAPRMVHEKFGASTTWMGKLLYRLNAGRNGGCPVIAIGITPSCISDWHDDAL